MEEKNEVEEVEPVEVEKPKGVDLFAEIATDPELETGGSWFDYMGARWLVASSDRPEFQRHQRQLLIPHQRKAKGGKLSPNEVISITAPAVARWLLVGWDGVLVGGKALPFSAAKAHEILTDARFLELLRQIANFANDADNFRRLEEDEDAGN